MFKNKKMLITAVFIVATLALTACGGANSESDVVEVQINLTEYGFESSLAIFEAGVPYRFTLVNEGEEEHELMLMPKLDDDMNGSDIHDETEVPDTHDEAEESDSHDEIEGGDMHDVHDELIESGVLLAAVDATDLQPGATHTFEYTFTETTGFGELEFACRLEGHYEEGMFLPIMVQ